jgi:YebC/PmpR family DNA-binding regulatory protein
MAGHSKWANIKHRKGAQDAKKGKIHGRLIKEITIAAQQGGIDPASNPRLRLAIQNGKAANLPKDNITRALARARGEKKENYLDVSYEGYGPHGIAILLQCATDNLNRTVSAVRASFTKYGGSIDKHGTIAHLFDHKGYFQITQKNIEANEIRTLALIEAGMESIAERAEGSTLTCAFQDFGQVQKEIESQQLTIQGASLHYIPHTTITCTPSAMQQVQRLLDAIEALDDVQQLFHNMALEA